jgi:hypothetical protein
MVDVIVGVAATRSVHTKRFNQQLRQSDSYERDLLRPKSRRSQRRFRLAPPTK